MKRIDNYGPPNAKSPFGASDDKIEKKSEVKTIEDSSTVNKKPESIDGNTAHSIDSSCKCLMLFIIFHLTDRISYC